MKDYIKEKKLREFGLLVGIILPILIGWILPLLTGHIFRYWTLWVSLIFLLLSFLKPVLLYYPYKFWMRVGDILGFFNSHLILGLIFILILQPIAFFLKIFGYDPLRIKKHNQKSFREIRKDLKVDLKKIF